MIVSQYKDTVQLRGSLHKNEWLTIKALARLMLKEYPGGILIDCTSMTEVSEGGAKTFLEGVRDIEKSGFQIMIVNLPQNVFEVVKATPGVRSQLPIARSIEEARASFLLNDKAQSKSTIKLNGKSTILVPLLDGIDVEYSLKLANKLGQDMGKSILVSALLQVARNVPLNSPMPECESRANILLDKALAASKKLNISPNTEIERVRDIEEGLLSLIKSSSITHVVVGIDADQVNDDNTRHLLDTLLYRAACNVIIARHCPDESHPLPGLPHRDESDFDG